MNSFPMSEEVYVTSDRFLYLFQNMIHMEFYPCDPYPSHSRRWTPLSSSIYGSISKLFSKYGAVYGTRRPHK